MDAPDAPDRPDRRRFLGLAVAGGALVVTGGAAAYLLDQSGSTAAPASATDATTGSGSLQVLADAPPPLPVPAALPADPNADTPAVVIGTIAIPRIGLTAAIQEGITLPAINRGPAHWPGTAMPGGLGNVVIAGHRTIYTKPFSRLDLLQAGDPVVMTTPSGQFTYVVRGIVIVPGEAIDIASQSYAHTATLFACHPRGSSRQRIVAKLALIGPGGQPVDAPDLLPALDAGSQDTDHTLAVRAPDPLSPTSG